jgi:hypothetical protein
MAVVVVVGIAGGGAAGGAAADVPSVAAADDPSVAAAAAAVPPKSRHAVALWDLVVLLMLLLLLLLLLSMLHRVRWVRPPPTVTHTGEKAAVIPTGMSTNRAAKGHSRRIRLHSSCNDEAAALMTTSIHSLLTGGRIVWSLVSCG